MALRQDTVRLLIADDVGIGKTIEAGLIAAELLAQATPSGSPSCAAPRWPSSGSASCARSSGSTPSSSCPAPSRRLERGLMLNESLFDRHPVIVVSTDFIKSPSRRHEFLNHCPDLVIVDEAHTASPTAVRRPRARTQRYDLVRDLADDAAAHLILVTATPHCGKEEAFRNLLGLLDPDLATIDLDDVRGPRTARAATSSSVAAPTSATTSTRTPLPEGPGDQGGALRPSRRSTARCSTGSSTTPASRFAATTDGSLRQRVRWWSALALLRTLASSPRAAAQTLRTRAARPRRSTSRRPTPSAALVCSTPPTTRPSRPPTPRPAPTIDAEDGVGRVQPPAPAARHGSRRPRPSRGEARPQARRGRSTRSRSSSPTASTPSCSAGSSTPPTTSPSTSPRRSGKNVTVAVGHRHLAPRASAAAASTSSPASDGPARPRRDRLPLRGRQPAGRSSRPSFTTTWRGTPPATSSARAGSTASASGRDTCAQ